MSGSTEIPGSGWRSATAAWLAAMALSVGPAYAASDGEWREVKDPHYGEVLFHFYQQQYFPAITQLMVSEHFERLGHHRDEAELLRGGLYLSYGLHVEAGRIFERLIDQAVRADIRDRAWFYLAKIRYQRGYLPEAEEALARIGATLAGELEDERQVLHATLLMARAQYAQAVAVLRGVKGDTGWAIYGRYNLGVALVKAGQKPAGVALLEEVGRVPARDEEIKALRDKANVALGYVFLQDQEPARAKQFLERVRLKGLLSTKALLGTGWALSALDRHEASLVPWVELKQRNVIDAAVQESLLAVPYAFGKLGAYKQSLQHYEAAIQMYADEIGRLGDSIQAIRAGKMVENILQQDLTNEMGWFWRMQRLPDAAEGRYLVHLLASHEFSEGFKNYRDMRLLLRNLEQWSDNIGIYDAMLATRRLAFEEELPRVLQNRRAPELSAMRALRETYAAELERVENVEDARALATAEEQDLLARLKRVETRIARLGGEQGMREAAEKYRLLRGLLAWRLASNYKARLWQAKKALRELDDGIAQAEGRRAALLAAQSEAPARFDGFGRRITEVRDRVARLQSRVYVVAVQQEQYLQELAVAELERQRQRLATYLTQARFAVAQIYDRAAADQEVQ